MSRRPAPLVPLRPLAVAAAALTLAACSGGDAGGPSGPRTPPAPTTGSVTIDVAGLPASVNAAVRLVGPAGERAVTTTATIADLAPGEYTVAAAPLVAALGAFAPDSATRTTTVRAGTTAAVRVRYDVTTGSLVIAPTGLPMGASSRYTIRPISDAGAGPARELGDTTTITHLEPGRYSVRAHPSRSDSGTWMPASDSLPVTIAASTEPVRLAVPFAPLPVRLAVDVQGLPANAEASMIVRGPNLARPIVQSLQLEALPRGTYDVEAGMVRASGFTWHPDSARRSVTLRAGESGTIAMRYAVTTGALAVSVTGVPEGFPASVRVTGPNDFTRVLTGTTTLTDIAPGEYELTADTVRLGSGRYDPVQVTQRVRVSASVVAAPASVSYRAAPGRLLVSLLNVPAGATATATLTGAGGWARTVSGSADLTDVPAGVVRVSAGQFSVNGDVWRGAPALQDVTVPPGGTTSAAISFSVATGRLQLTGVGVPVGLVGPVTLTGPNAFSRTVDLVGSVLVNGLEPGTYTVTASAITSATALFPTQATQTVTVTRGATSSATVT
ncbi:MAG: hypothetical protein MUF53_11825, partial [Gemmatimonadaceae bacterium]|nr:hypothetical protein [Gemmatimonadaceae bacterium]MCU0636660.1 hypothetical protein [Gemmatimonadaceae bacterium]